MEGFNVEQLSRAKALIISQEYQEAKKLLLQVYKRSNSIEASYLLGKIYSKLRKPGFSSKYYTIAYHESTDLFTLDDLIDYAKVFSVSLSSAAEREKLLGDIFIRVGADNSYSAQKFLMRASIALGGYEFAYKIFRDLFSRLVKSYVIVKEICELLYFYEKYDDLEVFLNLNKDYISPKNFKNYMDSAILFRAVIRKKLADESGFVVEYFNKPNNSNSKIIITFNDALSNKKSFYFGVNFFLKKGYDVIAINPAASTSYNCLGVDAFRKLVSPTCEKYAGVYCYGSSLGGYAALYYGGSINATIIAGSPLHPAHAVFGNKLRLIPFNHCDLSKVPKTRNNIFITHDPMDRRDEFFYSEQIRDNFQGAKVLRLPFVGHSTIDALNRFKVLSKVIISIIEMGQFGVDLSVIPNSDKKTVLNKVGYFQSRNQYADAISSIENYFFELDEKPDDEISEKYVELKALLV